MPRTTIDRLIINSPYEEPQRHWRYDRETRSSPPEWKDGKPERLATVEEAERSPRIFHIIRLECYEDTLTNLKVWCRGSDEGREGDIDLRKPVKWMIGLTVRPLAVPQTVSAETERDSEGRLLMNAELQQQPGGRRRKAWSRTSWCWMSGSPSRVTPAETASST